MAPVQLVVAGRVKRQSVVARLEEHMDYKDTIKVLRASTGEGEAAVFSFAFAPGPGCRPIELSPSSFPLLRCAKEPIAYVSYAAQPAAVSRLQPFTKYSVVDDDGGRVRVIIPLPLGAQLTGDDVEAAFDTRSFTVKAHNVVGASYIFRVGQTHHKLDPAQCSAVLRKDKIIIRLCHQNPGESFYSLHKVKMIGEVPED